jgi:hypothetical protein
MFEFLLGYWLGGSEKTESEHPRYFRETPPRKLTKEENKAAMVFLIALITLMIGALIISQDITFKIEHVISALH